MVSVRRRNGRALDDKVVRHGDAAPGAVVVVGAPVVRRAHERRGRLRDGGRGRPRRGCVRDPPGAVGKAARGVVDASPAGAIETTGAAGGERAPLPHLGLVGAGELGAFCSGADIVANLRARFRTGRRPGSGRGKYRDSSKTRVRIRGGRGAARRKEKVAGSKAYRRAVRLCRRCGAERLCRK